MIFNHLMEFRQIVGRYIGVHVVLDVVFHLPVQKTENGIQINRSGAVAMIFDVFIKTCVLGQSKQDLQSISIEFRKDDVKHRQPGLVKNR